MSTDSSQRFAQLELNDIPPARPAQAPLADVEYAAPSIGSNRDYNNANGCSTLAEALAIMPELACEVRKEQLFTAAGEPMPDAFGTIRTFADGRRQALGVVGARYKVVQDSTAFEMVQGLLNSGAIGVLNAGAYKAKTWIYGESTASRVDIVKGDAISQRVLFGNSHDGSIRWSVGMPGLRVVCQNTFAAAMSSRLSKLLKLRHTGNVHTLIGEVSEAINESGMEFVRNADAFKFMATRPCSDEQLEEYTGYVFSKWADDSDEESTEVGAKLLNTIHENFESGAGSDMTRGTAWGAFNAVTEYLSHQRGRSSEQGRFADLNWGAGAKLSQRALSGAMELAQR